MRKASKISFFRMRIHPCGLLSAAGTVACVSTLFGCLGRYSWFLDLFSHFRVQYLIGLSILGVLLSTTRRFKTAALFFVFAGINLGYVLPLYFGGQAAPPGHVRLLRAMLLNVNTRLGEAKRVRQVIEAFNPDLIVLEEINNRWLDDLQWIYKSYPRTVILPREDNFGIGLFSKHPLVKSEIVYIADATVPTIIVTIDTGSDRLALVATHPPPPWGAANSMARNEQLERLPDYLPLSLPTVLLGDLNATPWNYHVKRLLKRGKLIDSSQGRGIQPTWPSGNPLLRIPIDQCLHSLDVSVLNKIIGPDAGSDHYPVIVDLAVRQNAT